MNTWALKVRVWNLEMRLLILRNNERLGPKNQGLDLRNEAVNPQKQ